MDKDKVIWIIRQHKGINHKYGELPYYVHLQDAARFAKKYINLIPEEYRDDVMTAVWGHDLIEDPTLSYSDVVKVLGRGPADMIYSVSNEKGKTRDERANDKYYAGIAENHLNIFVKLCDRLANMTNGKKEGSSMYKRYMKEMTHFKEKLYNGMYQEMWDELENIKPVIKEYWPAIQKFDEDTIWNIGRLPKPIPGDMFREMYRKGVIPKKELIKNHYYYGKCRGAKVALWNGYEFIYMKDFWGQSSYREEIFHPEDDNGFDVFIPVKEVTPTDEQRVKY